METPTKPPSLFVLLTRLHTAFMEDPVPTPLGAAVKALLDADLMRPKGEATLGILRNGDIVIDYQTTGEWQWVGYTPDQAEIFGRSLLEMVKQSREMFPPPGGKPS